MATYTQENRLLTLTTPLGDDVLLLTAFSGREELSRLFHYELELLAEDNAIKPRDIVGKNVTWFVQHIDQEPRSFNGWVSRFSAGPRTIHDLRSYRMEVVPWLWFLTRTSDCRIFQHQTTPDIIKAVFKTFGFRDFELSLRAAYQPWEYCVQYRETAFNFVTRLMEHEGIFWYFKHENNRHMLVLADNKSAYLPCGESSVCHTAGTLAPNHIDSWEHAWSFRTGKWAQTDYNFKTPGTNLLTSTETLIELPGVDRYEFFDYPGEYDKRTIGVDQTRLRMEEEETPHDVVRGSSGCCTFTPGGKSVPPPKEHLRKIDRPVLRESPACSRVLWSRSPQDSARASSPWGSMPLSRAAASPARSMRSPIPRARASDSNSESVRSARSPAWQHKWCFPACGALMTRIAPPNRSPTKPHKS